MHMLLVCSDDARGQQTRRNITKSNMLQNRTEICAQCSNGIWRTLKQVVWESTEEVRHRESVLLRSTYNHILDGVSDIGPPDRATPQTMSTTP